ncbi:MAG: EthD family reductase [Bradyrhizobiaceae bacterium]|nr:EthD family reductase [Hyphomicrobiales bacterium]MBV9427665.1 EthD family reductase [Bradyrhizobiaceae bacterium]
MIKTVSLLVRKDGSSHGDFMKHWREIHGPLAYACPGVARYVQTEVKSSSFRSDGVDALDVAVDGIAELWFEDQAALDLFSASPATRRLREDGTTFIGRQISFTTEEKLIIPREG